MKGGEGEGGEGVCAIDAIPLIGFIGLGYEISH